MQSTSVALFGCGWRGPRGRRELKPGGKALRMHRKKYSPRASYPANNTNQPTRMYRSVYKTPTNNKNNAMTGNVTQGNKQGKLIFTSSMVNPGDVMLKLA